MIIMKFKKTVIINRAIVGSGKTTISNCITQTIKTEGLSTAIHSTDDYFLTESKTYNFIPEKLKFYTSEK